MREFLDSREVSVLVGLHVVDPLLPEDVTNELNSAQLVVVLEFKAVILQPLPVIVQLGVLVDLIDGCDHQMVLEPDVQLFVLTAIFGK